MCTALDEHVDAFRTRPLEGRDPYLFLDAKMEKVRDGARARLEIERLPDSFSTL